MIIIAGLIAVGILLDLTFVGLMWPPWRSHDPGIAWLLSVLALTGAMFETAVLLATYHIPVPALLALLVLVGKDTALVWRMVTVGRARNGATHSTEE